MGQLGTFSRNYDRNYPWHIHFVRIGPLETDDDAREVRIVADVPVLHRTAISTSSDWFECRIGVALGCQVSVII